MGRPLHLILPALLASLLLAGCGGGGGESNSSSSATTSVGALEPDAPLVTGNTATDGFNWFNFRRQQAGLLAVERNAKLDAAAQGHSDYQKTNNTITHEQTPGKPGFTGATLRDRLDAVGYQYASPGGYAYGEVISSTSDPSGFNAAEDLITAIYHRFVIFEPMFKEAGAGAATVSGGSTYFTTNFAASGLDRSLGPAGSFVVYPFPNQPRVPRNFFSDNEAPDPVPNRNEVGYPISVHADITATVGVKSFTVRPHDGNSLAVQLLSHANDAKTAESAAAIVPLDPLAANTTYDVSFSGTIDGIDVSRAWSFTTK